MPWKSFTAPGKDTQYPMNRRLGGPQSWSGYRLKKKSFESGGDETPVVQKLHQA
jgi:hypothetical protein